MRRVFTLILGLAPLASAQPAAEPSFEVATVKASQLPTPQEMRAGKVRIGMNVDGARVSIGALSLADVIRIAYRVKGYQVSGPDWMATQRFDIQAKIPEGVSKDQVPEMLQALLAERFGLKLHREDKQHAIYALVIAKGGPKMKEAEAEEQAPAPAADDKQTAISIGTEKGPVRVTNDSKGMVVRGGAAGTMRMSLGPNGMMRMEAARIKMSDFADMLSRFTDRPVMDATDLKGFYQVSLEISLEDMRAMARAQGFAALGGPAGADGGKAPDAASDPSGGSIFQSVQQLGLRLEARKSSLETLIVDHVEKTPTDN